MSAAQRLAALDDMPARELIAAAEETLVALVDAMSRETVLLRAGRMREAAVPGADKTRLAQDYVSLSRTVQRQLPRLKAEAPGDIDRLRQGHEQFATQMAENLKVIATARAVTEDLLTDVARAVGRAATTRTYGASGEVPRAPASPGTGIAVNRAL